MIKRTDDDMNIEDAIRHNEEVERREAQEEAQHPKSSGKRKRKDVKYLNFVQVRRDTWIMAIMRANEEGMKLGEYCGSLIDQAMRESVSKTPDYEIDILQAKTRRHNEWLDSLYANVSDYLAHPTDEVATMLMQQCDRLGVDYKEIINQAKNDPLSEAAVELSLDPDTKTNQCIRWMRIFMQDNNYKIIAREGNLRGHRAGFTRDVIKKARRRLGVMSTQQSGGEYWWTISDQRQAAKAILGDDNDDL